MTFIQLIQYRTTQPEEVGELLDRWIATSAGKRTATRTRVTRDRNEPTSYVEVLEFPSYELAMANSTMPETNAIHERFVELCEEGPTFVDLDVLRDEAL
ncbi:hypothetical protein GCM10010174_46600 [Kutzneria viridogrisea]|uniref:ABM domain-containing protein n=2 Tax=Kutzneria TaxID=43356 RepID=W5W3K2_9PSEU|nr:hypothetical protein [Kutzneria albida]AHH95788.1 hypothetical protein KALB_2420 [Kutzneria albida DSM 43870]MBA8926692.1 hypothetical protein [Kutzneria viridogrisea]